MKHSGDTPRSSVKRESLWTPRATYRQCGLCRVQPCTAENLLGLCSLPQIDSVLFSKVFLCITEANPAARQPRAGCWRTGWYRRQQSCGVERSNAPSCANVAVHIVLKAPGQTHKLSHEGGRTGHRELSLFSWEVGERETEASHCRCFFRVHMI